MPSSHPGPRPPAGPGTFSTHSVYSRCQGGYRGAVSVFNRRNALMGWAIWKAAKTVGKQKARDATPAIEGGKPNKSLIAVVLAAGAGAFALLRGRRSSTSD